MVFRDDKLALAKSFFFSTLRLLSHSELMETLWSRRQFSSLKPKLAISFQNIVIPEAPWLLHLQL